DNCEHLVDATAAFVSTVLDAGDGPRFLATSREALRIDGEVVHVLGSLGRDAIALFRERARAATGRVLATSDAEIAELCDRLDGLPLAIELAAAQLRHLTVSDLLSRLDDRLALLVGGRPRAGERHVTLAATIEWSHQLLASESRELFDALGVFPASFDLAAVRAVGEIPDAVVATHLIADLVAKNLVVHDPDTGRYRLLETIRLFAWQRLQESGRLVEATERLRRHVVQRATAMSRPEAWLSASLAARGRDDIENVRFAFECSVRLGEYADAVDIAIGLASLWRNAVSYGEGLRWIEKLRQCPLEPRDRLWLNIVAADIGLGSGDPRLMASAAAAAADLAAQVDDPPAAVIVLIYRSLAQVSVPERAVAGRTEASARAERIGAPALDRLARAFRVVSQLAAGSDGEFATEMESLVAVPSDGYDRYICVWAAWITALVDRAGPRLRRWMDQQLENVRRSGLRENWLTQFCHALTAMGEGSDYLAHLRRARARAEAEGRRADVDCVLGLAYAAACHGDMVGAAELIGASSGMLFHDTANFLHHMIIRDCVVRPGLDAASFQEALARGQQRDISAVLAEHGL